MLRILVAEDEAHNREALAEILKRMGHEAVLAVDGQDALEHATKTSFDVVLSDVRMPRLDGLQFFDAYRTLLGEGRTMPPFIFMTAYGRMEEAVEALRKGALHFLSKPLRKKDLTQVIDEARKVLVSRKAAEARAVDATVEITASGAAGLAAGDAIYRSRAFGEVVQVIDRVAVSLASVLLVGESGTGKEVLARRLHESSSRAKGPFVAFHAGAVPETLLESELFGHMKGAFTGAELERQGQIPAAHRGTFFIDEVSSMPLGVQAKLLRVLQDRQVTPLGATSPIDCDVRWVAATNEQLEPLVSQGRFREDLLYRLRVVVIEIPPLRERPEDIDVLAEHFLAEFSEREGRGAMTLTPAARELLNTYSWPGNVRELRNVMERAVALANGAELTPALLPDHIAQAQKAREIRVTVGSSLQSVEDRLIEETLRTCNGDKVQAAAILGVAPRTIYRWLERREQVGQ